MFCVVVYFVVILLTIAKGQGLIAVDVGGEYLKVAIIKIGMPMEIALNKDSNRKTPNVIAFRDGQRLIGESAVGVSRRVPGAVVKNVQEIIGKKFSDPQVVKYMKKYKHLNISEDPLTGAPLISISQTNYTFTPEELFSMVLNETVGFSSVFAGHDIRDVLLVFPPSVDYSTRRAAQVACKMSKLNLVGISDTSLAVAIQYVLSRKDSLTNGTKNVMVIDIGANHVVATIFRTGIEKTDSKTSMPFSNISGLSVSEIGVSIIDECLFQLLTEHFIEKNGIKSDIFKNPKVEYILRQESIRIKHVLTVNSHVQVHLDDVYQEYSLNTKISKEDMENKCSHLFDTISKTIKNALLSSSLEQGSIDIVIPVGGGSLIPKVQQTISETLKMSLSRIMNTDDSVALGASFIAARISKHFRVFKFLTRNSAFFPIELTYNSTVYEEGNVVLKQKQDTLYRFMSPLREKKVLLIKNQTSDLTIFVSRGVSPGLMSEDEGKTLMIVNITGINDAVKNNQDYELKHLSIYFSLDNYGLAHVTHALVNLNRISKPSIFEKVGKVVSNLIKKENTSNDEQLHPDTETISSDNANQTDTNNDTILNSSNTLSNSSVSNTDTEKKIVNVTVSVKYVDNIYQTDSEFEKSIEKLLYIQEIETQREEDSKSRSNLERLLYETKDSLDSGLYKDVATEEEINELKRNVSEIDDWFDEYGASSRSVDNTKRINNITELFYEVNYRLSEERELPKLVRSFNEAVNQSFQMLNNSNIIPGIKELMNSSKYDEMVSYILDSEKWLKDKLEIKKNSSLGDSYRVLTTKMVKHKTRNLLDKVTSFIKEVVALASKKSAEEEQKAKENNNTSANPENKTEEERKNNNTVLKKNITQEINGNEQINTSEDL